jgi:hypothetical protein
VQEGERRETDRKVVLGETGERTLMGRKGDAQRSKKEEGSKEAGRRLYHNPGNYHLFSKAHRRLLKHVRKKKSELFFMCGIFQVTYLR